MKHSVIAMKVHSGALSIGGCEVKMKLPKGCDGILFCFESKKAARDFWGKDTPLVRCETEGIGG